MNRKKNNRARPSTQMSATTNVLTRGRILGQKGKKLNDFLDTNISTGLERVSLRQSSLNEDLTQKMMIFPLGADSKIQPPTKNET